jgi:hypothetical protein
MEVFYPNCAGLDVHKETVVACSRQVVGRKASREVRTFKITTSDLLALSEWLSALGCTHIAMEATGVYWKPVWHILSDGDFALTLTNAAHVKNVPGRKTDVNDATWLADLLAHGLIRGSFVPDEQTLEQRGLLRTRKQLIRERTSHVQRLQKTLEEANIKLDSVISDIVGTSGRAMIEALFAGETDPAQLARSDVLCQSRSPRLTDLRAGCRREPCCLDRASVGAKPSDVGDQALMRGLDTAGPIVRPGLSLSYGGRRHRAGHKAGSGVPLPCFAPADARR